MNAGSVSGLRMTPATVDRAARADPDRADGTAGCDSSRLLHEERARVNGFEVDGGREGRLCDHCGLVVDRHEPGSRAAEVDADADGTRAAAASGPVAVFIA